MNLRSLGTGMVESRHPTAAVAKHAGGHRRVGALPAGQRYAWQR